MAEHGKCVRLDVRYEDGTLFRFDGEAAEQHHADLDAACGMAQAHGWAPRQPLLPPTVIPAGEKCGEEFWTEDADWVLCTQDRGHDGDCYGPVIDHDPETCGADENGDVPKGGCVHAKGHAGKCWDGIGPSPSTRRAGVEAPDPAATPTP